MTYIEDREINDHEKYRGDAIGIIKDKEGKYEWVASLYKTQLNKDYLNSDEKLLFQFYSSRSIFDKNQKETLDSIISALNSKKLKEWEAKDLLEFDIIRDKASYVIAENYMTEIFKKIKTTVIRCLF